MSVITDGTTGDMVTLMHNARTFLKTPAVQMKEMMEQLKQARAGREAPALLAALYEVFCRKAKA